MDVLIVPSHKKKLFSLQGDLSMPLNRVALIIPGIGQKTSNAEYHTIGNYYKSNDITPVFVDIDWKRTGLTNLAMVASQISSDMKISYPDSNIFLFGFSFGAAVAYKLSESVNPAHTLLCSMSPVFAEDRKYRLFPLRQLMGLVIDYSSNHLSYSNNEGRCFVFLYGDREFLVNKSIIEHRKLAFAYSKTIMVKGAGHDISNPAYLGVIKNIVSKIPRMSQPCEIIKEDVVSRTSEPLTMRVMLEIDIQDYSAMFQRIFAQPPWNEAWTLEGIGVEVKKVMRKKGFIGLVAEHESQPAGYLTAYRLRILPIIPPIYYLNELFVDERYRGIGTGKRLLSEMVGMVNAHRGYGIVLLTKAGSPAEQFYLGNGFKRFPLTICFGSKVLLYKLLRQEGLCLNEI